MNQSLSEYLVSLADDELILGHRVSEWCGHAPILEEDIAFANIALDEIGHARLWLQLAAEEIGEDPITFPDRQTFFRSPEEFRNLPILEIPNGDWAFSMLRQYIFDSFEIRRLEQLKQSSHEGLADLAAKILTEEIYHLRHTQAWIRRLAQGTPESATRTQAALEQLWPYIQQFSAPMPGEDELLPINIVPASAELYSGWHKELISFLEKIGLQIPAAADGNNFSRSAHTVDLAPLIADLQEVARLEPEGRW